MYGKPTLSLPEIWCKRTRTEVVLEAVKGIRTFLEDKRSDKVKLILEKYDQEIQLNEAEKGLSITYDLLVFFCLGVKVKPVPAELENVFLNLGYTILKRNGLGLHVIYKKGEQNVPENF